MESDAANAATPPTPSTPALPPSDILDLPFNIQTLRTRFFAMESPITMPISEFNAAWPFLDNIYVRNSGRNSEKRTTTYYWCRLWPKKAHAPRISPEKRQRNRTVRTPIGCPCKIKAVSDGSFVTFTRTGDGHNHDYAALGHKITTGVRELAAREVSKGYKPSQIAEILKSSRNGNLEAIQAAGGGALKLKDIHNAGQHRRRSNVEPQSITPEVEVPSHRKLQVRGVLDGLFSKYHELESMTSRWPSDVRDEAVSKWINDLDQITQFLRREELDHLRTRLKPDSQRALTESEMPSVVAAASAPPAPAVETPEAGREPA
ncbi:hypothetical protein ASPWEDRAFT_172824 [Aspergillus wentii DTO 134E9]|uniref:Uncharacterized protein n=1 Tax=Aspergillus wentii DTO 134E9 TaxID=1073089 RepID=A0A1L9RM75_ASPWE|nr:uncharacterized protein ASPWEDRAFT_172824 [Aspergillus wentii DTO 134E9]KAI9929521.1 hypothetical protein MW887_000994 [Aspergillus wentii]OJJ36036.1 hypothetical protein ASPWEDRAFT_172824 [Aspergillus wentii DTO 134E9]